MCKCESKDVTCDNCDKLYICDNGSCFNSKGFINRFRSCQNCYITYKKCMSCAEMMSARAKVCGTCTVYHRCPNALCNGYLHNLRECKYPKPLKGPYEMDKNKPLLGKYIKKRYGVPGYLVGVKVIDGHVRYFYDEGCSCCGKCAITLDFVGDLGSISSIFNHYLKIPKFTKDVSESDGKGYTYVTNYKVINSIINPTNTNLSNKIEVYRSVR